MVDFLVVVFNMLEQVFSKAFLLEGCSSSLNGKPAARVLV